MTKLWFFNFNEKRFEQFHVPVMPKDRMLEIARIIVKVHTRMILAITREYQDNGPFQRIDGPAVSVKILLDAGLPVRSDKI